MENIENDFRNYLDSLLKNIPKPENATIFEPGAIKYGQYTREFNRKALRKLDEVSLQVRDQPEEKTILNNIMTEYRTKLMTGHF